MYICYAQTMNLRNPWIVLRKVMIDTLRNKPWIICAFHGLSTLLFAQSMDLFISSVARRRGYTETK